MRVKRSDNPVLLGEFARAAHVSRATAYIWARCGDVPAVLRGGRYEINRAHLSRILADVRARRRHNSRPPATDAA